MKQLQSGQHFGAAKKIIKLKGSILTEAGYVPQIEVPWHYHENAYFYYHLRGRLDEVNKKQTLTCTPGTLLFHHWQDPHYDKNFSTDAIFFHIELEKNWFTTYGVNPAVFEGSLQLKNPVLKTIFQKIHHESKINDGISQVAVDGLLLQAFAIIMRDFKKEGSGTPRWVKRAKEFLNETEDERITLQKLSSEVGMHPVHLSKEFPKYFNAGFGTYLRALKVKKAAILLLDDSQAFSAIAYQCGFADQSHFIRCFKAVHGITPSQFRFRLMKR